MTASSLTPAAVETTAQPHGRMPFGFGRHFFIALLVGLIWLIPAWWSPRFIAVMFLWDAVVLAAWIGDLRRLPDPADLTARRSWSSPLVLAQAAQVSVELKTSGGGAIHASLIDEVPVSLRDQPSTLKMDAGLGNPAQQGYSIFPRGRGDIAMGQLFLRYRTTLGLAERWATADLSQTVRVLPDIGQAERFALYLIRSRQVEMEKRRRRQRGNGREFEALREYRQGDDPRDVCWTATARRHQLTTRTYQIERSQTVWIVLDAGRLLRARVRGSDPDFDREKLDYAVDAALSLAQVTVQSGDRVGLLAYGRSVQQSIPAGRGPFHLRTILDALAMVRGDATEASHHIAARALLRMQNRRALIVWVTDFAETPATPEVIEYATHLTHRHLVVFAALRQPDLIALGKAIPRSEEEMFRHAAAVEILDRRERLLRGLRQRGVLAIDLSPGALAGSLVNQYLEIKDRGLL